MKYVKLVLINYNRLRLNNIKELVYTPETTIQLILGTNGSGKSSLIKELSANPPDMKKEYSDGGVKEVTIENNENTYVLRSEINNGKTVHSFKLNNEELNSSGIRNIQLSLVSRYLNTTIEIHELMTGVTGFCDLSVAARKRWFTKLSNIDYTYALEIYKKLSERHRDVLGAIKQHSNKLLQEKTKSLTEEALINIKKDITITTDFIESLISSKNKVTISTTKDYDSTILDKTKDIIKLSKSLIGLDLSNIDNEVRELTYKLSDSERNVSNITERIKNEKDTLSRRSSSFSTNAEDIKKGIERLKIEKNKLLSETIIKEDDIDSSEELISLYDHYYSSLTDILVKLPDSSKYDYYTIDRLENINNKLDKLESKKVCMENRLTSNSKSLLEQEHLESCSNVECPKCKNTWIPGFNPSKLRKYRDIDTEITNLLTAIEKDILSCNTFIEEYYEYTELLKSINSLVNNLDKLNFIWEYCIFPFDMLKDQKIICRRLFEIKEELPKWTKLNKINKTLKELESDLKYFSSENKYKEEDILSRVKDLEKELSLSISIKIDTEKSLSNKKLLSKQKDDLEKLITLLSSLIRKMNKTEIDKIDIVRNNIINSIITASKEKSHELEQKLNDHINHASLVKYIEDEIELLKEKEKVLKIAIDKLSPTTGLIGKNIIKFIDSLMKEMTEIINQLWTYDIEVRSCKIDDEGKDSDLDYRFPLLVSDTDIIPDVSKASSSMKEVINLAFKIVAMKYLGIENGVLFLDEFGRSFDSVHRDKAYEALEMLSQSKFDQVFIISHYKESYGRYTDADISVLSSDNLDMHDITSYNKVLKIK